MAKEFKDWVDEFVKNGANPKDVPDWPENAGGSTVVANPTLVGDEPDLTGLEVDGAKYKVGGGGEIPESYKNYYVVTSDDITDFTPLGSNEFEITLSEELENVITDFKQGIYIDWATLFPDIPYPYNVCCYVPTKKVVLDGKIHYLLSCVDSLIDATLSFYKIDNQWKLSMIEANLVDRETLNYEVSQLTSAIDGKSKVVANPTLSGDEATLEGAEIDGVKYKIPQGGGSGGETPPLYEHNINLWCTTKTIDINFSYLSTNETELTIDDILSIYNGKNVGCYGLYSFDGKIGYLNYFSSYNNTIEVHYIAVFNGTATITSEAIAKNNFTITDTVRTIY